MNKKLLTLCILLLILCLVPQQKIMSKDYDDSEKILEAFESTGAKYEKSTVHIIFDTSIHSEQVLHILSLDEEESIIYTKGNEEVASIKITYEHTQEMIDNSKALRELLKKNKIDNQIMSVIYGSYDKKVNNLDMVDISNDLFESVGAQKIEGGFITPQLLSVTGYSPNISNYILTGGNKLNINIVLKQSKNAPQTELIIATPVIFENY